MAEREIVRWVTHNGKHFPIFRNDNGELIFGIGMEKEKFQNPSTKQDLYNLVVGKDSYVNESKYRRNSELADKYLSERLATTDKIVALSKELEKEKIYTDDTKGREKWFRDLLADKTDRGVELEKEIKQLRVYEKEMYSGYDNVSKYITSMDDRYAKEQIAAFENSQLLPTEKTEFAGFQMTTATGSYQDKYEKGQAFITEMSPKEYLQRMSYEIRGTTLENTVSEANPTQVAKYAKEMREGTKYYMGTLDYENNAQEGRHRALAAIINGYEKIPVMIIPKRK